MYYPNKEEFIELSKKGNLIPVYRDILTDFETPLSAFAKIDKSDYSFLLESVEGGERLARYSILGSDPSLIFSSKLGNITITEGKISSSFTSKSDPIDELKKILNRYKFVDVKGLPRFSGGLVGFFGYDMVRFIENLPAKNPDDLNLPDCLFMLTDTLLIFDHVDHKIKVISNVHVDGDPILAYDKAIKRIERIAGYLKGPMPQRDYAVSSKKRPHPDLIRSNLTKAQFETMVKKAKKHIEDGDIIQTVLSQRLKLAIDCHPFQVYRALRSINPSPYMYYLKFNDFFLVGSSPEIMVRCENGLVEVRPIAGTRPRGASESEDEALIKDLLADPKEISEHIMLVDLGRNDIGRVCEFKTIKVSELMTIMLVDLGRNDIGRVCEFKTIKVSELMTIEKYSHVMHIVSDVSGRLKGGKDSFDLFRATFPAGTVTGAPKVRAMEIIEELENLKRGPYAGSIGYFSFSGNLDTCITIRTVIIKGKTAYIQAGAGIVADSIPEKEFEETLNKAKALLKAIEMAERGLE
ncbi:MAG: chorismate-binding protein [Candidatus Omnitrophica bacterium]|nr:chorismate-binding protein [Candidatus Omnitrophota bacterium]